MVVLYRERRLLERQRSMVMRKHAGFMVVVGKLAEITMNVVMFAAFAFQLDGHVFDAEILGNAGLDHLQQVEGGVGSIDHDVGGQHNQAWFHSPNMEIMDVSDAWNRFDGRGDVRGADRRRCGFQQDVEGFLEQGPRAMRDGTHDEDADQRIKNGPTCQKYSAAAEDDS